MRKKGQRYECASTGAVYNEILNSKHNGKVLENGDIRVGPMFALNTQTNMLYKV